MDFKALVEPLRDLFKDEVRQAGRELGLPEHLVSRQPFPGPGLAIRIIGDVTPEKVALVQDADAIWREEVDKLPADQRPSQYFAALTNMRSVGVMGDEAHLRLRRCPARRDHHRLHDRRGHPAAPADHPDRRRPHRQRGQAHQPRHVRLHHQAAATIEFE